MIFFLDPESWEFQHNQAENMHLSSLYYLRHVMSVLRFNPIFDILILRRYSMISYDHNFFDGSSKIPNRSIMIFNNPSNHNHSAKTPPPPYDRRPLNFKTETLPNFQIQYIPEKQKQYMMRLTITSLVHLNAYITPHPSILS